MSFLVDSLQQLVCKSDTNVYILCTVLCYFGFLIIKKEVDSRRLFPLNIEPSRAMGMLPCHCLKKSAGGKKSVFLYSVFCFEVNQNDIAIYNVCVTKCILLACN